METPGNAIHREPWNKGKIVGQKAPFNLKDIWVLRFGREVISKGQRPWGGCLDGMNADGLIASVTFGGSPAQGLGFAIIHVVRYILETCSQVSEAIVALCRIPVALSQNAPRAQCVRRHARKPGRDVSRGADLFTRCVLAHRL